MSRHDFVRMRAKIIPALCLGTLCAIVHSYYFLEDPFYLGSGCWPGSFMDNFNDFSLCVRAWVPSKFS